jgi:predicted hydrocarbon binding protein
MSKVTHERGINGVLIKNWLKERFGTQGLDAINHKLSPKASGMLQDPVMSDWYPAELVAEIFKAIEYEYKDRYPDILVEYGRYAADKSVKGFLRYLARLITIETLTKRMMAFWKQYHKGGSISAGEFAEAPGRKMTVVTVEGFEFGPPGCEVIQGYLEALIPFANVKDVKVKEKTCIYKGDLQCSWEVSWDA